MHGIWQMPILRLPFPLDATITSRWREAWHLVQFPINEALSAPPYSREDTAYREYLVKLRFVPEKMFTAEGKKIAAEKLQFMQEFFSVLESEIG